MSLRRPLSRRVLSVFVVCLLGLGLTVSPTHSHDGGAKPTSCVVCHVGAEPALDAPGEELKPEAPPYVVAASPALAAKTLERSRFTAVLGPRAPPA